MRKMVLAAALSISLMASASHAALVYTFNYDAFGNYAPASISFTSQNFAQNTGDVLTYLSGDINGCAPSTLALDGFAFATPVFGSGSCGDGIGPDVDGLFFRPDVMPPLTTGIFVSTGLAGRQFEVEGGNFYEYVGGSLTIRDVGQVPEPHVLSLLGMALLAAVAARRARSRR